MSSSLQTTLAYSLCTLVPLSHEWSRNVPTGAITKVSQANRPKLNNFVVQRSLTAGPDGLIIVVIFL